MALTDPEDVQRAIADGDYRWEDAEDARDGYEVLRGPGNREVVMITEPEDRCGSRDLAGVADELNWLKALLSRLEAARLKAEGELSSIDAVLARRPALDLPTRRENIEKAISVAAQFDNAEAARQQAVEELAAVKAEAMPDGWRCRESAAR